MFSVLTIHLLHGIIVIYQLYDSLELKPKLLAKFIILNPLNSLCTQYGVVFDKLFYLLELYISCYLVKELSGHGLWGAVVIRAVHRVADAP